MHARTRSDSIWSGKLTPAERKLATPLLARMAAEGPLCSQDIPSDRKAKAHAWDSTTIAKSALQKLFFHGRVLISRREANRRYYDLPEHVLPASVLNTPVPGKAETTRWLALLKLRQRRLAVLKTEELRVLADDVIPVAVEEAAVPRLHVLRGDVWMLEPAANAAKDAGKPLLIAPLDPIIYDRRLADGLWNFDYRWEVYVPPHKRVRGYYALPILHGQRFIGHADVKADRSAGVLQVVSRDCSSTAHARTAIRSLAGFLGLASAF